MKKYTSNNIIITSDNKPKSMGEKLGIPALRTHMIHTDLPAAPKHFYIGLLYSEYRDTKITKIKPISLHLTR